jgi:hypothetical protein
MISIKTTAYLRVSTIDQGLKTKSLSGSECM